MAKKQMTVAQLRNLPQYRNLSDEELKKVQEEILRGSTEERKREVLERLKIDYDLSDMNENDRLSLDNLAQIFVRLDDLERTIDELLNDGNYMDADRLNKMSASLRRDASQIQQDLAITRKARKGDKEEDLVTYIADLKTRAKKFLEERLSYIYCPECKMLLANTWFLYPGANNAIKITCNRVINDEGDICGKTFQVKSKELLDNNNCNIEGMLPV